MGGFISKSHEEVMKEFGKRLDSLSRIHSMNTRKWYDHVIIAGYGVHEVWDEGIFFFALVLGPNKMAYSALFKNVDELVEAAADDVVPFPFFTEAVATALNCDPFDFFRGRICTAKSQ